MIWAIPALICIFQVFQFVLFDQVMQPHSFLSYCVAILFGSLMSLMVILVFSGLAFLTGLIFPTKTVAKGTNKLKALRIESGVHGSFFLGTGFIEGEQHYFFYKQNEDGSVSPDKVEADSSVKIFEEERTDAELVWYDANFTSPLAWIFGFPALNGKTATEIHVPNGSVKTGYNL